jgi:hypothetical protein
MESNHTRTKYTKYNAIIPAPLWLLFDQGPLNYLANPTNGLKSEDFIKTLNRIMGVDLFIEGFKAVDTPFSFLEAIGITDFPGISTLAMEKIKAHEILSQIKSSHTPITELPGTIAAIYRNIFLEEPKLQPQRLIKQAHQQLSYLSNNVVAELIEHIIPRSINQLTQLPDNFQEELCNYLAIDCTQQFQYSELLATLYPDQVKRNKKIQEIYHAMFVMNGDTQNQKLNISYFRTCDRFRNHIQAANDPYKTQKGYLENGKDWLDTYLTHFAINGFWFGGNCYKVSSFTFDTPEIVRARITYELQVSHWIKHHTHYQMPLHLGTVYCFDKESLEFTEKIEVNEISFTSISEAELIILK